MAPIFATAKKTLNVARLVSIPPKTLEAILVSRGIPLEDIGDVEAALLGIGAVFTPADAVRFVFTRTTIPPQRFNTEHFPAFYTAIDEPTCLAEIKYHLTSAFTVSERRYYQFLYATFSGSVVVTFGQEASYPDLISSTSAGYPFCQSVATTARSAGHDALYASSARCSGICVPIFSEGAISTPHIETTVRFTFDGSVLHHEMVTP